MKRFILASLWLLVTILRPITAQAHFIWIETNPKGEPGANHVVEIYFGEPHEFLREEAGGLGPKKERTKIDLRKAINLFGGSVIPRNVGRYNLIAKSMGHEVQDLTPGRGASRPLFFARTQFLSFEEKRVSEREEEIKEQKLFPLFSIALCIFLKKGMWKRIGEKRKTISFSLKGPHKFE